MRRIKKVVAKAANEMFDATPSFVSLVTVPANQQPFNVVKSAQRLKGNSMPKNQRGAASRSAMPNVADIISIRFASEQFARETSVTRYLDRHSYESYEVVKTDEGYSVAGVDADGFDKTAEIEGPTEGVTYVIGVKTDEVDDAEAEAEAEAAEKAAKEAQSAASDGEVPATVTDGAGNADDPEAASRDAGEPVFVVGDIDAATVAKRYDEWNAHFSDGVTIEQVMKDGADGLPPGLYEVTGAFMTALRNTLTAGETSKVKKLAAEYGTMIVALADTFASATYADDAEQRSAAVGMAFRETPAEIEVAEPETVETVKTDDAVQPAAPEADTTPEGDDTVPAERASVDDMLNSTQLDEAIAAAVKQLSGMFSEQISAVTKTVETTANTVTEAVRAVESRVDTLETAGSTRKSAAETDADDVTPVTRDKPLTGNDAATRLRRNVWGMQNSA